MPQYTPWSNFNATLRDVLAEKRTEKSLQRNWKYNPQMIALIQKYKQQRELEAWRQSTADAIRKGKIPAEKMDEALMLMQGGPEALQEYKSKKLLEDQRLTNQAILRQIPTKAESVSEYGPIREEIEREKLSVARQRLKQQGTGNALLDAINKKMAIEAINQMAKLQKIPPLIGQIRQEYLALEPKEGFKGKIEGQMRSIASELGVDPQGKAYKDVVQNMSVQTARALGDVGNIAVAERKIMERMFPKLTDPKDVGLEKLNLFERLVQSITSGNQQQIENVLKQAGIEYEIVAPKVEPIIPQMQPTEQPDELDQWLMNELE